MKKEVKKNRIKSAPQANFFLTKRLEVKECENCLRGNLDLNILLTTTGSDNWPRGQIVKLYLYALFILCVTTGHGNN